ncbi:SMI1/KNR4 family protein [Micromonospora inositola]|uniref:SMI1 / KNR4 family (SUKH-1) n=1 Tax=Micromonospora inositola TaxID=47865 RepID=A0A1C5HUX3_9ACTN|nr:SMI1/KNR4 family protein [Micromonospora inositola]SCG49855.1 SMI1 / KNR4 family (SUKH-1) [Micromonospora inositola]
MTGPFEVGPSPWIGPPLTEDMVRRAEETLGVRLPRSYVELMYRQNGGVLKNSCYPTSFRTSWAADHFGVDVIMGIGYEEGVDAQSANLISEWDYPKVGVVLGVTPAAGPDTVMLDYSESGPGGEPAVVYVDEDKVPRRIADSFGEFMNGLVSCEAYEDDDEDQ